MFIILIVYSINLSFMWRSEVTDKQKNRHTDRRKCLYYQNERICLLQLKSAWNEIKKNVKEPVVQVSYIRKY